MPKRYDSRFAPSRPFKSTSNQRHEPSISFATMKFCKNLQQVADLSNPEWSPYWTDYKKLKVSDAALVALQGFANTTSGQHVFGLNNPSTAVFPSENNQAII